MKKIGKKNIQLSLLITILVVATLGTTYAYLNSSANNSNPTGTGGCFNVAYTKGQDIDSLISTSNYEEGTSTTVTLSKAQDCEIYTTASIHINTTNTTSNPTTAPIATVKALKYKIVTSGNSIVNDDGTTTSTKEGVIDVIGDKTLANVNLTTTATQYTIYLWIDSSISEGQFDSTTYSGYIYAESTQASTIE